MGFSLHPFQFNPYTTGFLKFQSGVHVKSPQGSLNKHEPLRVALKALCLLFFPVASFCSSQLHPQRLPEHFLPLSRARCFFPPLECAFTHRLHALLSSSSPLSSTLLSSLLFVSFFSSPENLGTCSSLLNARSLHGRFLLQGPSQGQMSPSSICYNT